MADNRSEDTRREAQARLDALLQEGLDSGPATPMTAEDWSEIRREVKRRGKEQAGAELPASAQADILHGKSPGLPDRGFSLLNQISQQV